MTAAVAESSTLVRDDVETTASGWQLPAWGRRSACQNADPEALFPENGRPGKKQVAACAACPVRAECLEFALSGPWMPYGPWGGLPQGEVQRLWEERHPATRGDDEGVLMYLGVLA